MMENDIADLAEELTTTSEFGIVVCRQKNGLTLSIKGTAPELAFLIALVAKKVGDSSKIPLEKFGDLINKALAVMLGEAG